MQDNIVNHLGSRRGIHKIGFIYFTLLNVKPMSSSRLKNIHILGLLAAFSSNDRVKYGFDKILAPIVQDVKELERSVDFTLQSGAVIHKRGTIVQLLGDNLGLNQLCGFVESFSAVRFCRICMVNRADSDDVYSEDQ